MTIRIFGLMGLGALALAACGQAADAPSQPVAPAGAPAPSPAAAAGPDGFHHAAALDDSGYYMPTGDVMFGDLKLRNIAILTSADFASWEKGERPATHAPVMIEFEDISTPKQTNELGQEFHTGQARVLPLAYAVDAGRLYFMGRDARLGEVVFDGVIDRLALTKAKADGSTAPVLTGTLRVGVKRLDGLSLIYFAGD